MTVGSAILSTVLLLAGCDQAPQPADAPERKAVILATTTSTQDSGLLDLLLPLFEERTGYRVKTIAVGTGEALAMGTRGDADVLLAHAPAREKELVEAGFQAVVMHGGPAFREMTPLLQAIDELTPGEAPS